MAIETENYKLKKPESNDYYNIDVQNGNMDIIDTELKNAQNKADQAFQSASNGKEAIKSAITGVDPEVTIPNDATFAQLAAAIGQIQTGVDTEDATATAAQILAGMTAYVKSVKVTGTMVNRGPAAAETVNLTTEGAEYAIPVGYHSGLRKIKAAITNIAAAVIKAGAVVGGITGNFTADATATAAHILSGVSAYVNGNKVDGNIPIINPDYGNHKTALEVSAGPYSDDGINYAYLRMPNNRAYYNLINYLRYPEPYLRPEYIVSGVPIMGVVGSAVMGKKFATGMVTSTDVNISFVSGSGGGMNMKSITVTGLTFQPGFIFCKYTPGNTIYYIIYMGGGFGASTTPGWSILFGNAGIGVSSDKYQYGGQLGQNGYVNSAGFCLPTDRVNMPYTWYAWE